MASMALALPHKPPGGSGIDGQYLQIQWSISSWLLFPGQYHPIYDHGHGPGGGEPTLHHVRALARARAARAHARAHAHAFEPFPDYGPYHPGFFKREAGARNPSGNILILFFYKYNGDYIMTRNT